MTLKNRVPPPHYFAVGSWVDERAEVAAVLIWGKRAMTVCGGLLVLVQYVDHLIPVPLLK